MDDLKEILAAATPGPWIFDEENVGKSGEWCWQLRTEYGGTPIYVEVSDRFNRDVRHEATARLIAMAPDLAAEVLRLRAEVERLTEALQNALAAGLPDVVADAARAALPGNSAGTGCKLSCECPDCNEM